MSRTASILRRLRDRRLGFNLHEIMTGYHEIEGDNGPSGRQPLEFRVTWGPEDLWRWLDPRGDGFMVQSLRGTITVGGVCPPTPCWGALELRYLTDHAIRYTLRFDAEGIDYRFTGEKVNIRPWNLPVSHTTCFGTLIREDTHVLVSRAVTHFRLRTLPAFLGSFRLRLNHAG